MQRTLYGIVIVWSLAFFGCTGTTGKADKIRIGHFPNLAHAQALVGRADGAFEKAFGSNTTVEWKEFNAGPAQIEALFAGELDIGTIGPVPAINGFVRSRGDVVIIAGAAGEGAILLSRSNLFVSNVKDFDGKSLAVPQFGNTQDLSLRDLLARAGLKDKTKGGTVEIRAAENADIKALLERGEIDGALVPEPWGSRLIKEVGANIVLEAGQIAQSGKYAAAVVVVRKDFLKANPGLVEIFLKTHIELTKAINQDPEAAKTKINAQLLALTKKPLPRDILDSAFARVRVTTDPQAHSVADFAGILFDTGVLKAKPDLTGIFELSLLEKLSK